MDMPNRMQQPYLVRNDHVYDNNGQFALAWVPFMDQIRRFLGGTVEGGGKESSQRKKDVQEWYLS